MPPSSSNPEGYMKNPGSHAPKPSNEDPLGLHGVIPPTITAFHENESVDPETTAQHARYVVDGGARGVFPLGTNGECPMLNPTERVQVIEAVSNEISEVPVIAGVGAESTRTTIDHAERAEDAGADGLVVVTPYYYPMDGRAAIEHYRRITESVELPVYVYHIPSRTGNSLSLDTLASITALDGIAGVKDSSKEIPWLGQAIANASESDGADVSFLVGSDSLLVPGLDLGCSGLVSAIANVFPELVVGLYDAYDSGEREEAQEIQRRIYAVRRALKRGPYMAGVKSALSLRGFEAGPLRSPLRRMSEEEEAALEDELGSLDLL